ncbi:Alpha/Beta hydrolase protein [Aspergillus alliaceus]|uniref:Alpha/Beta hydrolase protein n=1 Tax=Petromyces alliaceus TaxID=209559 RepID=UPI0012A3BB77|nr:Alpha/Beta hydrolase protein [Aspergillus alliaceus]KAB8238319.1 Alpha/Beta hydrolase protein [Aspergillus alliaceus]
MYFRPLKVLVSLAILFASTSKGIEQTPTASDAWSKLPSKPSIPLERVQLHFSPDEVYQMHESLNHAQAGDLNTYKSEQRHWISLASEGFSEINESILEIEINRHPQFNASVTVDGHTSILHFMAVFSQHPDAIPVVFLHDWPGSFLGFLDLLDVVRQKYSPEDSPFHLIVPSLPGYAFSPGSPISRRADLDTVAQTVDALLTGIGLDNGYIAQGGGMGSYVARLLGSLSANCEAVHVNSLPQIAGLLNPSNDTDLSTQDFEILSRTLDFKSLQETATTVHTKQAALGALPEKNPLSLLAWLDDKFKNWVDPQHPLPMQTAIIHASIYYLTKMTTSEYYQSVNLDVLEDTVPFVPKPFGYSRFPFDISGVPRKWVATLGDLVWFTAHDRGGHFAPMERPEELWNDIEHFVRTVFPDDLL